MRIAKACHEAYPQKPIVWGGVHVTFQPVESLREKFVDYVIIGEGELRFPRLLKAIEIGKGFKEIDGIGYKKESVGFTHDPDELAVFESKETASTGGVQLRVMSSKREIIEMHDSDGLYEGHIIVRKRGLSVDLKRQYVRAVSARTMPLFVAAAQRNELMLQTSRGCNWSPTSCEFCSVAGQYTETDPGTGKNRSVYRYIPFEHFEHEIRCIYATQPFTFMADEAENSSWFLKDWRYAELLHSLGITYHWHDPRILDTKVEEP